MYVRMGATEGEQGERRAEREREMAAPNEQGCPPGQLVDLSKTADVEKLVHLVQSDGVDEPIAAWNRIVPDLRL